MIGQEDRVPVTTAYLVGIQDRRNPEAKALLDELSSLVDTMGLKVLGRQIAKIDTPHARLFVGIGKAEEIIKAARDCKADCLIFDNSLSPSQQRNWEDLSELCVIDRQEVILDIFAHRASSREAVIQVGLARMEYSLPRLTRGWTHLSRQRGGTRGTRGEGETQLEVDRRIVLRKIAKMKKELKQIHRRRKTQRKQRRALPHPSAGLVGYTNAGKSSLLKALSGKELFIEDKLFATLDPTTRRVPLGGGGELLITDTVGFVRNLPHNLVEAFRSTLEETLTSDFLIHVVDASNPESLEQAHTSLQVLAEAGAGDKPILTVFNKRDLCNSEELPRHLQERFPGSLFVSARSGEGLKELFKALVQQVQKNQNAGEYLIPPDRYDLVAYAHRTGRITRERHTGEGIQITATLLPEAEGKLGAYKV